MCVPEYFCGREIMSKYMTSELDSRCSQGYYVKTNFKTMFIIFLIISIVLACVVVYLFRLYKNTRS